MHRINFYRSVKKIQIQRTRSVLKSIIIFIYFDCETWTHKTKLYILSSFDTNILKNALTMIKIFKLRKIIKPFNESQIVLDNFKKNLRVATNKYQLQKMVQDQLG